MKPRSREIVIVRSLTDSDLGLFAAHRVAARSKQRALNINAPAAERLLSKSVYKKGSTTLDCLTVFGKVQDRSPRHFGKVHKNWRLGGRKLEATQFADIDSADFALIRSPEGNDGTSPVSLTFVSRTVDPKTHQALSALLTDRLRQSVLVVEQGDDIFSKLAILAVEPPADDPAEDGGPKEVSWSRRVITPMPREPSEAKYRKKTIREKLRSPNILERMLRVSGDLSAPAQLHFMDTVEQLASQLREVLLAIGGIIKIERNHNALWTKVAGRQSPSGDFIKDCIAFAA